MRRYAHERAAAEPDSGEATSRLLGYYLAGTEAAATRLYPYMFRLDVDDRIKALHPGFVDDSAALGWLDAEHDNVLAAVEAASGMAPRTACALAVALRGYVWFHGCSVGAVQTATAALAAAAVDGTTAAQMAADITAAIAYHNIGDLGRARRHGEASVHLVRQAGIRRAEPPALANLASVLLSAGEPASAAERLLEALALARGFGRRDAEGPLLVTLAAAYRDLGRLHEEMECARAAVESERACGGLLNEGVARTRLGELCHLLGDLHEAAAHLYDAIAKRRNLRDRPAEISALAANAVVLADQGRLPEAIADTRAASEAMGGQDLWTEAECRNALGTVMSRLGRHHDAVEEHARALDLVRGATRCAPTVTALIGLSQAHHAFGETREAAACAREALKVSQFAGYRVLEGQAHPRRPKPHWPRAAAKTRHNTPPWRSGYSRLPDTTSAKPAPGCYSDTPIYAHG